MEKIRRSKPPKALRFLEFFIKLLRPLFRIPPLNKYLSGTVGGLNGSIFNCQRKNEYEKATKIAIRGLEKYRHKKSKFSDVLDHHNWWRFMKYGVDSAGQIENKELVEKLINLAKTGMEPFEGYDVAYSYLEFSRWKYQAGKYEEAVEYAVVASQADATWAEPDFILGWYGLQLSTGNAEKHLSRAIEKDHRWLFRVANDDICKRYPHIISKLKEKYVASEIGQGRNKALKPTQ